jgi:O-antigen ligase
VDWVVLAVALPLVAAAAVAVWRRPVLALYAFVVGLAAHNAVFVLLFAAGAGGWQVTVAQAWKETLLAVALARVARDALAARSLPFAAGPVDALALAFAAVAVLYALLPQDVLGGEAGPRAEVYGLRHVLLPVAAYALGRAVVPGREELRRLAALVLGVAAAVAALGLAEEYAVGLHAWRTLGAPEYFSGQLGFEGLVGPAGLPENWVLNSSEGVFRRLVSTLSSPLGSAYLFVTALLFATGFPPRRRPGLVAAACLLVFAGLLFSFTRSGILALAGGLAVLALLRRRWAPLAAAALVLAAGAGFAAAFPKIAPETAFFPEDIPIQEAIAAEKGGLPEGTPLEVGLTDPSSESHLSELRRGAESLADHPQGYGPGNSGQAAARFGVESRAGESVYLEVGADLGIAGLALWAAFCAALLAALGRRARQGDGVAAAVCSAAAALFAIALISDVWGNPWNTYALWWLAGSALAAAPARPAEREPAPEPRPPLVHA